MTDPPPQPNTQRVEASPYRDPGQYVCRWTPLSLVTVAGSLALLAGGYLAARQLSTPWGLVYVLTCVIVGLMLTLAATAWGVTIALAESPQCGTWFVLFPPYVLYYAATRWRWMAQPSILFLCGIGLAVGAILAGTPLLQRE